MNTLAAGQAPRPGPTKIKIEVIAYVRDDPSAGRQLAGDLAASFAAAAEDFQWSLRSSSVATEEEATRALAQDDLSAVIFASPDLIVAQADEGQLTTPLVKQLRSASAELGKPLILLALATPTKGELREVDAYLPLVQQPHVIANVRAKIFHRLSLKLPPVHQELDHENAIRIQVATKPSEMLEAFRLRYKVYHDLGYLPQDDSPGGGLDVDAYDKLSCQFVAVDHREDKVIGSFRLVMNRLAPHSSAHFDDRPAQVLERQRNMVDAIVDEHAGTRVRADYRQDIRLPLPIFRSMDFSDRWSQEFDPILKKCCEVSRIVVEPGYRGLKLLDLMMRTAAFYAYDFGKSVVLLECVSHHIAMYEKYGYRKIGLHGTCQELDQKAAGMRLDIPGTPDDSQFHMAKRLIDMLLSQPARSFDDQKMRHLCVCSFPNCWQNGSYAFRSHAHCPLVDWH